MVTQQATRCVRIGLESLLESLPAALRSARLGLLANYASVDSHFRYAWDVLNERFPKQLRALFSPQHGLFGVQQANMIETPHSVHTQPQIPIYSLYSETRRPTAAMLRDIDCLIIDLQDVGTRVYTFAWTMAACLAACHEHSVEVIVLDRPNPLGGRIIEGPRLATHLVSFVGGAQIPMRHGLTLGELARWICRSQDLDVPLHVVPMQGWRREMLWHDTGRTWIATSPNMPHFSTVLCYPGQVLLEGTNVSEGRGTTTPFEVIGAPWMDGHALLGALAEYDLPGVCFRPIRFQPSFDKWAAQDCAGLFLHVLDSMRYRPMRTTVALLGTIQQLWPEHFALLPPPYEYEHQHMPLDIISGTPQLRERLQVGDCRSAVWDELVAVNEDQWWQDVENDLLYA